MASSATNAPVRKPPRRPNRRRSADDTNTVDPVDEKRDVEGRGEELPEADEPAAEANDETVAVVVDVDQLVISPSPLRSRPAPPSADDVIRTTGWVESVLTEAALKVRNPRLPKSLRGDKIGGTAPFVQPEKRLGRWLRMRDLGKRGYVPLHPGPRKLRHRILPRSVIGISTMLLMFGVGSAFSGAAFYAYYDNRLAENEQAVSRFVEGFDQQFTDATGAIDQLRVETITEIRDELKPLGDYVADADGVVNLPRNAGPSVWLLETRDEDGQIVTGSAFAVVEYKTGTALVTSYSLVVAAATEPSPGIDLMKGNDRVPAQLWSWDPERDIALVVVDREIPTLDFAGEQGQLDSLGSRVFALSGVGGNGATASPGVLLDHSQIGLQHTAPIGTLFRGGPLLNGDGKVLGVASDHYRPFGIDPGDVRQAPDVRALCVVLLECSEIVEEVVVDVVAEETDAPLTTDELVRETPTGEDTDGSVVGSSDGGSGTSITADASETSSTLPTGND